MSVTVSAGDDSRVASDGQPYSRAMLAAIRSKIIDPLSEFAMIATPLPVAANAVR